MTIVIKEYLQAFDDFWRSGRMVLPVELKEKFMDAMLPKVGPNPELIKGLELMLAKARLGEITDGLLLGCGYSDPGGQQPWFHHFSIERPEDVVLFVGELDIFKDVLKASVHNSRNLAAAVGKVKSIGGLVS